MPRKSYQTRKHDRSIAKPRRNVAATQAPGSLDSDKLRQLYATMLRCRMAAERARLLAKEDIVASDLGVSGQEAAEVGALIDLLGDDCVAPGRRDLAACLIRGWPLKAIFTRLYERALYPASEALPPPTRSYDCQTMISPAFALSTQLNLVTGVAWALKRHGRPNVAVTFSGDDSASLGFWRDALKFCAAHRLPMVHIIYNNAGDGSVSARLLLAEDAPAKGNHLSLPAFNVDGSDVVAVYRVAQEAIRRARQGYGPALIECQTYRWCSRLETDSSSQRPGAVELEQSADPIARMEAYLQQKRLWSDKWKQKLAARFSKDLDAAVEFAKRQAQRRSGEVDPSRLATAS